MAGFGAFRESYLNADPLQQQTGSLSEFDAFSRWESRITRYDLLWSFYQNNAFRDLTHNWSPSFKRAFGLYAHTRNIFNPFNRLVEFHVSHLMGGRLDPDAGDGETVKTSLPIIADSDMIRPGLAKLWKDSRWQGRKSLYTRFGAAMGDHSIIIDDDLSRGRVTMRVIHPGHIKWVEKDYEGRVLSYILEKWRYDPRSPRVGDMNPTTDPASTRTMVKYNEEAFIGPNGLCTFKTYKDGIPFDWRGATGDSAELPAEWETPYRFVPMVCGPHMDIGLSFGVSESHAMLSKVLEVDDMASNLGDQIRKRIQAPKLLAGVTNPSSRKLGGGPEISQPASTPTIGQPGYSNEASRQNLQFLYGPENAKAIDMTNDLDIPGVSGHIQSIISELERDYPELQMDIWATGDPSGRALRIARQRTENKIQERRVNYDAALVQAQKFAMAIGGMRGYRGYEGLDADPWEDGSILDHEIGYRPVFSPDPLDDIEESDAFWGMVSKAVTAGMPLAVILKREGWNEDDIAELEAGSTAENESQVEQIRKRMDLKRPEQVPAPDERGDDSAGGME